MDIILYDLMFYKSNILSHINFIHKFRGNISSGEVIVKYGYLKEKHEIFVIIKKREIVNLKGK